MPVFLIERNFAEKLEGVEEVAPAINQVNAEAGVQWLISFLSANKKKTYCLYEASSTEAIREAARQNGLPADTIVEVSEIQSTGVTGAVKLERFA